MPTKEIGDRYTVRGRNFCFSRSAGEIHVFVSTSRAPAQGPQVSHCGALTRIEDMERPADADPVCLKCFELVDSLLLQRERLC